ncbi:hypothetical protein CXG81DRAFT_27406 [Caulochytrium protostelioides]|uniref:Uncharacterized protein n=1 Tax=Caulochytrium protostelioides TaxID=1555241 RepID=A0A4V1IUA4_9FUNG|nr:hypothetical protein CXG81DRAFT_27406 [Caulochytrium protostelioides]|eukprot:RKO99868.1 hypothetical protein CXG81DRAFT_27406 [Caulochytrium protostelioides]
MPRSTRHMTTTDDSDPSWVAAVPPAASARGFLGGAAFVQRPRASAAPHTYKRRRRVGTTSPPPPLRVHSDPPRAAGPPSPTRRQAPSSPTRRQAPSSPTRRQAPSSPSGGPAGSAGQGHAKAASQTRSTSRGLRLKTNVDPSRIPSEAHKASHDEPQVPPKRHIPVTDIARATPSEAGPTGFIKDADDDDDGSLGDTSMISSLTLSDHGVPIDLAALEAGPLAGPMEFPAFVEEASAEEEPAESETPADLPRVSPKAADPSDPDALEQEPSPAITPRRGSLASEPDPSPAALVVPAVSKGPTGAAFVTPDPSPPKSSSQRLPLKRAAVPTAAPPAAMPSRGSRRKPEGARASAADPTDVVAARATKRPRRVALAAAATSRQDAAPTPSPKPETSADDEAATPALRRSSFRVIRARHEDKVAKTVSFDTALGPPVEGESKPRLRLTPPRRQPNVIGRGRAATKQAEPHAGSLEAAADATRRGGTGGLDWPSDLGTPESAARRVSPKPTASRDALSRTPPATVPAIRRTPHLRTKPSVPSMTTVGPHDSDPDSDDPLTATTAVFTLSQTTPPPATTVQDRGRGPRSGHDRH